MKTDNGFLAGGQYTPVAIFSWLLGAEMALASYTNACSKEANASGLWATAALLAKQHKELERLAEVGAGFAIAETKNPVEGMKEFVAGSDFISNNNKLHGLAQTHAAIICIIEAATPFYVVDVYGYRIKIALETVCGCHRAMAKELGKIK